MSILFFSPAFRALARALSSNCRSAINLSCSNAEKFSAVLSLADKNDFLFGVSQTRMRDRENARRQNSHFLRKCRKQGCEIAGMFADKRVVFFEMSPKGRGRGNERKQENFPRVANRDARSRDVRRQKRISFPHVAERTRGRRARDRPHDGFNDFEHRSVIWRHRSVIYNMTQKNIGMPSRKKSNKS